MLRIKWRRRCFKIRRKHSRTVPEAWRDSTGNSSSRKEQEHVHEFEGSTKLAEFDEDVHNHRFAGVTGEEMDVPGGHVHKISTRTDFFDHFHLINVTTGLQVPVGDQKHVHFARGMTNVEDGHSHEFQVATLIQSPLLPEPNERD